MSSLFTSLAILIFLAAPSLLKADVYEYSGVAKTNDGKVFYTEKHRVEYKNGRLHKTKTTYFHPETNERIAVLNSSYPYGVRFPEYQFKDFRRGYEDGVRLLSNKIHCYLIRTENGERIRKDELLQRTGEQVIGQGFHYFIQENLQRLQGGETLKIQFVIPAYFDQFSFRIRKQAQDKDSIRLRLESDFWVLRLFVPHISVRYDLKSKQLLSYEGPSNIKTVEGDNKNVKIEYTHPPA